MKMSRLYDSIEPNVIDEKMLQKAVEEQGPQEELGQLAKREGIDYKDVLELQLDFRNILKIDNLWQFVNLTKLQLDNNIIEKIESLDSLVHLVWLDLSFNNIEVIEGLESLVKLQDLSLYNNRISKIENLDTLQELQVFSIGNNNITALENREVAEMKYQYAIDELKQGEAQVLAKLEEEQAKEKELEYHKAAYVEYLNGPFLFESMYAEDTEAVRLAYLPGMADLLETYKNKFVSICENLFAYGLKEHEKRQAEVSTFYECLEEAIQDSQRQGIQIILDFENYNEGLLDLIQNTSSLEIAESKLVKYNEDISQLSDTLMTLEMQMVDQLEEIIKDFERNIADQVSTFIENVQGMMVQCRDLENHHHEKLLEIAINTLEKIVKSEFDEDMPDDVRLLFVDKDTIVNAVNASHDIHLLKIDNREDDIITKANSWSSSVIDEVHKKEISRNRNRVREINQYIDHLQEELDNMESLEQME
ncbi:dynein regulatory complex subunit 3 isoform X2 [Pelodiscus sinensis]|uniref:dynein regulatory complex subunit 3 isoform X2 n=1 Tax=Pelodiscus sinensis TaxID=13735 RepID=UPI0003C42ADD|nr:dynein regulatory complex subunit 3 isoform X2 [Pelodiscus sinensis]|eukprot:XP_025042162.1 dynein regulatory complex subunit 3 isoform X2 [Pelodiscus sinensis]